MSPLPSAKPWIALVLALILVGAFAFTYRAGRAVVRADWDKERTAQVQAAANASEARRMKERALSYENEKITAEFNKALARSAAAERLSSDRLRDLKASLGNPAGVDTAALGGADDPRDTIIDGCASALVRVDKYANEVASKAIGLQSYARDVCMSK